MIRMTKFLMMALILVGFAACGSGDDDACDGVTCLDGSSCVVQDSGPACVPDGEL